MTKFCTTYCELIGIAYPITIYHHNTFGFDHFIKVVNDKKPFLGCFVKKGNTYSTFYTAQVQLSKFQKLRRFYTGGKKFSFTDKFNCSVTQEELQLNRLKHKQVLLQVRFATLTHDNHIIPLHYLVELRTVPPSQKDDCHPGSADFANDHFSIRDVKREQKTI